jgi:hypothetical protein
VKEVELTAVMLKEAETLGEGQVLISYLDGTSIRMETEEGEDPYVWRQDHWQPMSPRGGGNTDG